FSVAAAPIWKLISRTNKYIDETEPWVFAEDENKKGRLGTVMAQLVEALRISAAMKPPFLPETPDKMFSPLGLIDAAYKSWNSIHEQGKIPAGIKVEKGTPIFPRLDMKADVEKIKNMMTGPDKSSETEVDEAAEEKPE